MGELDSAPRSQRLVHRIGIDRFYPDNFDFRIKSFYVCGDTGNKSAATDRGKYSVDRASMLTQNFHSDGTLPCYDIGIIVRMHKSSARVCCQFTRMSIGLVIGIAVSHHRRATRLYGLHLDLRSGDRHYDSGVTIKPLRRECYPLSMVAGGSGHHTTFERGGRKLNHFIVSAPHFKREYRLHILPLQKQPIVQAC